MIDEEQDVIELEKFVTTSGFEHELEKPLRVVTLATVERLKKELKEKFTCQECKHIHIDADWCMGEEDTCTCEVEKIEAEDRDRAIDEVFSVEREK